MAQPRQDETEKLKLRRQRKKTLITIWHHTTKAFVIWLGEALVGLLPLIAHSFVAPYSHQSPDVEMRAYVSELSILSVVISGLSILSLLPYGLHPRKAPFTAWTYLLCLVALFGLVYGTLLYALEAAAVDTPLDTAAPWYTLFAAVVGSLGLALERAVFESNEGEETGVDTASHLQEAPLADGSPKPAEKSDVG